MVKRIGLIKDEGKRIIDADGLIVSPGFPVPSKMLPFFIIISYFIY